MFGGDNGQELQLKSILGPGKEIVVQYHHFPVKSSTERESRSDKNPSKETQGDADMLWGMLAMRVVLSLLSCDLYDLCLLSSGLPGKAWNYESRLLLDPNLQILIVHL